MSLAATILSKLWVLTRCLLSVRPSAPAKLGVPGGPCTHCGTCESPQWRRHLTNNMVLCNACGIYYRRHHALPKRKAKVEETHTFRQRT